VDDGGSARSDVGLLHIYVGILVWLVAFAGFPRTVIDNLLF